MTTKQEYLNLIPSQHREKPDFAATVGNAVGFSVRVCDLLDAMIPRFDVDAAVGDQLDMIGVWVGVSRNIEVPISNVYFTWNSSEELGWEFGSWQPANQPANVSVLPDDAYRTLIKGRIAANAWSGLTEDAYAIWAAIFPEIAILIKDNQDMSYDLILFGAIIDSLTLALLTGGYIPLKPEGVRVNTYYVPINPGPLFGWDRETEYFAGWEEGSWTREISSP